VLKLCNPRWQIELAFKRMKSISGSAQLPKKSDLSRRASLHARFSAW
jgi:IS4 transposase